MLEQALCETFKRSVLVIVLLMSRDRMNKVTFINRKKNVVGGLLTVLDHQSMIIMIRSSKEQY